MGAPEMYPEVYAEHLTGDPVYDKAFIALADCPSFAQVEAALKTYARGLAEKIREESRFYVLESPTGHRFDPYMRAAGVMAAAADLIDPEVT
ncbi:hypothetical protein [Streptomyces sp. CC53]|uniref:hypothetical protein n=1 Tax=Streptomyces sp. CC53 TaxID=1906740 RepID=UPI0008DC9F53|nr:hypothetical protein [Streptomyces sp. CC53]